MFYMLTLLLCINSGEGVDFKTKLTLDPVPLDHENYVQGISDLAFDDAGQIYMLDMNSKCIFVWNKDGSFKTSFGKEGQGPGEFNFRSAMGGNQGQISLIGEDLYIYDGGNRTISRFGPDHQFIETVKFMIPNGRAEVLRMLSPEKLVMFNSSYTAEVPFRQIAMWDKTGEELHTFVKAPDQTWRYGANRSSVVLFFYAPSLYLHYNRKAEQLIIGNSSSPKFEIYDLDANLVHTVEMPLVRKELTDQDRQEIEDMEWLKRSNFFSAELPDEHAFWDRVLPVGKDLFLVYLNSPRENRINGYLVNKEGKLNGRFNMNLGPTGGLFGDRGRLVRISTNEDGDFIMEEIEPAT